MLDIKFIRENQELVALGAKKKHISFDVSALVAVDDKRLALLAQVEALRAKQNAANEGIAKASASEREPLLTTMRAVKDELEGKDEELKKVMDEWRALMLQVPNIPDMSVPEGVSDADNQEFSTWGEKPHFTFTPKNHADIMESLGLVDFERGAKVSGFRG